MTAIHFRDLVALTAGDILQVPVSYKLEPDAVQDLITEFNLSESTENLEIPSLTLDEIAIDLPVHFRVASPGNSWQLMTVLPSPLVPQSIQGLSHFRVTLKLNPEGNDASETFSSHEER